jgi:hypothetical protein
MDDPHISFPGAICYGTKPWQERKSCGQMNSGKQKTRCITAGFFSSGGDEGNCHSPTTPYCIYIKYVTTSNHFK